MEKGSSSSKPSSSSFPTSQQPNAQPHYSDAANIVTKDIARQSTGKAAEAMDEAEPRRANAGDKETGKSDPTIFKLDLIRDGIYTSFVDSSSPPPPPTTARLPEARMTVN